MHDPKDPTSASEHIRTRLGSFGAIDSSLEASLRGLVVGIPKEYFPEELDKSVYAPLRKIIAGLRDAGARVVSVSLPSTKFALSAYYVIASAEASSNLARYSGIHYGQFNCFLEGM